MLSLIIMRSKFVQNKSIWLKFSEKKNRRKCPREIDPFKKFFMELTYKIFAEAATQARFFKKAALEILESVSLKDVCAAIVSLF